MTIIEERLAEPITLRYGLHDPDGEMCLLEAVAWVAGEPWTDHPACVCPVLAAFGRAWNDGLPDDETRTRLLGPFIPRLVGTVSTPAVTERRAFMAFDWLVRVYTPAWLRKINLDGHADTLANLDELTTFEQCEAIRVKVAAADTAARVAAQAAQDAAWVAAGDAAQIAAEDAAGATARAAAQAAWAAAQAAAGDAAQDAAGDAAQDAAWVVARAAAGANAGNAAQVAAQIAARDAAGATAWDAAGATAWAVAGEGDGDAAWAAAWAAARDTLADTVTELQASAVDLYGRMIEAHDDR